MQLHKKNSKKINNAHPQFATALIYLADAQLHQGQKQLANKNYLDAYFILKEKLDIRKKELPEVKNPTIYADMVYCLNAMQEYEEAKKVGIIGSIEGGLP